MSVHAGFRDYPVSFPAHAHHGTPRYCIRDDCFAALAASAEPGAARVLFTLPDEGLSVFHDTLPAVEHFAALHVRPVYSLAAHELPAVPTGRVFVQARAAQELATAIAPLGYRIESVPPYAPQAAWLVAGQGSIAAALAGLEDLFALDVVVSGEAQMLRPVATR